MYVNELCSVVTQSTSFTPLVEEFLLQAMEHQSYSLELLSGIPRIFVNSLSIQTPPMPPSCKHHCHAVARCRSWPTKQRPNLIFYGSWYHIPTYFCAQRGTIGKAQHGGATIPDNESQVLETLITFSRPPYSSQSSSRLSHHQQQNKVHVNAEQNTMRQFPSELRPMWITWIYLPLTFPSPLPIYLHYYFRETNKGEGE